MDKELDLTLKNKKGQTPIDITNSKTIIGLFLNYLKENSEGSKENKPSFDNTEFLHKRTLSKKCSAKILIGNTALKEKTEPPNRTNSRNDLKINEIQEKLGISSFIPIKLLGKGSFGQVYLVKRKTTGKYYAMKMQSKSMVIAQNLTRYVYAERNVQSSIPHNFIVKLRCAFQTKTKLLMVMDYCKGGDLGHVLQREKRFPEDRARIYVSEILLAIEELHKHEIIYRDLKPDNIVLDENGHALLTDFGLSKQGVKCADFTQSFCGSVAYLAPEVLRRSGHGRTVDWYLLGVLLYEMIVGIPPYFNRNKYF